MEVFNSPVLEKPQFFCRFSPFRQSPPANLYRKNPSWNYSKNRFHFILKFSFSSSSNTSNCRNLRLSAHLGRASKRRNSLRKKLLDEGKVCINPEFSNPIPNFNNSNFVSDETEKTRFGSNVENADESDFSGIQGDDMENGSVEKSNLLGDSVLWSKLENWTDQYKKDTEYWGVGSGPIFNVYQDLYGNVNRVSVNNDEILRRSRVEPSSFGSHELGEDTRDLNSKISQADLIARQIKSGEYKLPKNSSIATFVVQDKRMSFIDGFRSATLRGDSFSKLSRVGFTMLCGCLIIWAAKKLFVGGNDKVELTREEEEMLRRKMRSRMEREKMEKGSVEVVGNDSDQEPMLGPVERPLLDKNELMKSIVNAKAENKNSAIVNSSDNFSANDRDFNAKILEIREMARRARELEQQDLSKVDKDREENDVSVVVEAVKEETGTLESSADKKTDGVGEALEPDSIDEIKSLNSVKSLKSLGNNHAIEITSLDNTVKGNTRCSSELSASHDAENSISQSNTGTSNMDAFKNDLKVVQDRSARELNMMDTLYSNEEMRSHDLSNCKPSSKSKSSVRMKPRIIRSVEEAQDYLSRKHGPLGGPHVHSLINDKEGNGKVDLVINGKNDTFRPSKFDKASDPNASENSSLVKELSDGSGSYSAPSVTVSSDSLGPGTTMNAPSMHTDGINNKPLNANKSWMEENFQEFEPIIKKIGVGFQENYMVAKEKVQEQSSLSADISQLGFKENDEELEWMKDDGLREIVFQVRENELAGRDPFHLMDAEDQNAFFKGLERKAEKVNEKLSDLHEWVHSRIENLDYGADGISLDDPPEKIIPRWKGPTLDKDPEFLNNFVEHRNASLKNIGMSTSTNQDQQDSTQKLEEPSSSAASSYGVQNLRKIQKDEASGDPKTVIECSDGSTRPGEKTGKEHWKHTKKWSREFLEVYNAETDPEVKSIMKDMGKDLDRWITEKEIQESADLMTRIPKRKRRYIEKKMDKLKREMAMFGPHAVVSKYREYSEEKEEDNLWWLDLPYVLCIELYIKEEGIQKVGFYSLEMAADLELDPKQYHVVAFEDPGDCKSFCYILQAHMEMLGNGCAFVVARPPKEAFREAKGNNFNVTVIRKGKLQLNVDQTLEEVESEITEIGSKIYHDKIMSDHSVNMSGLMKGVFGAGKTTKRRPKRMLTMPTKR